MMNNQGLSRHSPLLLQASGLRAWFGWGSTLMMCLWAGSAQAIDPASPYGINTHIPSVSALDRVQEAGIGWVRFDFNWFQMEPNRDSYSWGTTDNVVNAARARGQNIFATLAYSPDWAGGGGIQNPAIDTADWYDFVYDTVSRYKGSIKHWGIWNEPNLEQFFNGTVDDYVLRILIPGYQAVKAADPSAQVLGPELAYLESADWRVWLYKILEEGGDYIDIITQHCYSDNGNKVIRNMDGWAPFWSPTVYEIMQATGTEQKPLWLTETGWHTDEVSEATQALYYEQTLEAVLDSDVVDKVFFYELTDDPNITDQWGILTSSLTPKEAFFAYRDFIQAHPF